MDLICLEFGHDQPLALLRDCVRNAVHVVYARLIILVKIDFYCHLKESPPSKASE